MNIWFSLAERFDLQFKNTDTMASKLEEQRVFMVALSQGEAILENDEQYAFAAGQVIYYLLQTKVINGWSLFCSRCTPLN